MISFDKSGVSLGYLRSLADRNPEWASTQQVIEKLNLPEEAAADGPFIQLVPDEHRGAPCCVAVHAWSANFRAFVKALAQALPGADDSSFYVWIDVLACNLDDFDDNDRLDAASHAATAHTDVVIPTSGPSASAFKAYREAIQQIISHPPSGSSPAVQPGFLAVVLDANVAVLSSPLCLYGIWLCIKQHIRESASPIKPPTVDTQPESQPHPQSQPTEQTLRSSFKVLCTAGLDVFQAHLAWEELSLLQTAPNVSETLQSLIVEEVASEKSLKLPSAVTAAGLRTSRMRSTASTGSGGGSRGGTGTGDGSDLDPDVEARVIAADAAIKFYFLNNLEQRVEQLTAAAAAIEAPKVEEKAAPAAGEAAGVEADNPPPVVEPDAATAAAAATAETAAEAAPAVPLPPPELSPSTETPAAAASEAPPATDTEATAQAAAAPAEPAEPTAPAPDASGDATAASAAAAPASEPAPVTAAATAAAAEDARTTQLEALAAASDAFGCFVWAAGRPADAEPYFRRALKLRADAAAAAVAAGVAIGSGGNGDVSGRGGDASETAPKPSTAPPAPADGAVLPGDGVRSNSDLALLSQHAASHLGAVLHVLPYVVRRGGGSDGEAEGEESERLLRAALTTLEAMPKHPGAGEKAAAEADGASGKDAAAAVLTPSLLAAQVRHFLAQLLSLRAAAAAASTSKEVVGWADGYCSNNSTGDGSGISAVGAGGGVGFRPPLYGTACMQLPYPAAEPPAEVTMLLAAALPVFESAYGNEHLLTAALSCSLGQLLKSKGRLAEAEPLLRRAVTVRQRMYGPAHPDTLRAVQLLAGLEEEQGNLFEAESLLRASAEAAASQLGPDQPHTATALANLGLLLKKTGKLGEAGELFSAALDLRERQAGTSASLATAACLRELAEVRRQEGREEAAEQLMRRILDIRELVLGPSHPATAAALADLAALLGGLGRWGEAELLMRRSLSVHQSALGPTHSDTAAATRDLARVLAARGRQEEAEALYRRALKVMESALGPEHPETVATLNLLALLLKDGGPEKVAEAEALFLRVLNVCSLAKSSKQQPPPDTTTTTIATAATTDTPTTTTATDATATITPTATTSQPPCTPPAPTSTTAPSPPPPAAPPATTTTTTPTLDHNRPSGRLRRASLVSLRGLAELAAAAGRLGEAEELCCRLLVASEEELGPVHASTLESAEMLAAVLRAQAMYEDAAELYARLVETTVEELGEEAPEVAKYLGLYEEANREFESTREPDQEGKTQQDPDQQQQQQQPQQQQQQPQEEDDDTTSLAASSTAATIGNGNLPAGASQQGHQQGHHRNPSVVSGASAVSFLLGSFIQIGGNGNRVVHKPSPLGAAASGGGTAAAATTGGAGRRRASTVGGAGGGEGEDGSVRRSFASFVGRRGSFGGRSADMRNHLVVTGRAQSIVQRVHSSLVASGRINTSSSGGGAASVTGVPTNPGTVARPSRFQAESAAGGAANAANGANGAAAEGGGGGGDGGSAAATAPSRSNEKDDADGALTTVSPGLPDMGPEASALAGAANVSLDTPPPPSAATATQAMVVLTVAPRASRDGLAAGRGSSAGRGGENGSRPTLNKAQSSRRSWGEHGEEANMPYGRRKSSELKPLSRQKLLKEAQIDLSDSDGEGGGAGGRSSNGKRGSGGGPTSPRSYQPRPSQQRRIQPQLSGNMTAATAAAAAANATATTTTTEAAVPGGVGGGATANGDAHVASPRLGGKDWQQQHPQRMIGEEEEELEEGKVSVGCCGFGRSSKPKVLPSPRGVGGGGGH